jgi:hypothetical protein
MKLFKDDYSLIFKYYNVTEDTTNINSNKNLNNTTNVNKPVFPGSTSNQAPKPKELYFTIDDIEKSIVFFFIF